MKPTRRNNCSFRFGLANLWLAAAIVLLQLPAFATPRTWNGASGSTANWSDANNWVGGTAPATNNVDALIFSGSTRQNNTNNFLTNMVTSITFSSGGWTLNGNPVTLGGPITNSTGNNVINNNLALSATRTVYFLGAGQLSINGAVSGAFGLATGGGAGGTLALSATNTYTGGTTINAGSANIVITSSNALGTGSVSIPKTGTTASGYLQLQLTGVNTITNAFAGFSSTTFSADATVPDIENLSGTNTILSSLTVTGTGGNGLSVKSSGGLLILNGNSGATQTSRGIELNGSANGVVNGAITNGLSGNSYTITKDGTGTWTLNGTNSNLGNVVVSNGKLALGPNGSLTNAPNIEVASGAFFDASAVTGGWLLLTNQTLQGNGAVMGGVTCANGSGIQPGVISSPGTTAGTLVFSNNLTLNGGANLKVNLSSDPTGLSKPSDLIVVSGNLTATGTNKVSLGTYLNGSIANGTYHIVKFNGSLTGDATNFSVNGFVAGGRGVQNGYIVTNTGYIDLVVTGAVPANLVWRGDGAANNWDIQTTSNWLNGVSADEFYNNDSVTFNDTATNFTVNVAATVTPGSVTVNATNNYTIAGSDITGTASLTKQGSGKLTLTANNTFTGTTTYGGGSIVTATIGNSAAASPIGEGTQVFAGGTLEYTGSGETSTRAFSVGTGGGTLAVDTAGAVLTFSTSGVWTSGGNTFNKTGPGTLAFSFQQTMTGTNNILGGILKIPTVSFFGTDMTTPVFINGGELDLNGQNMSTKPVNVAGMGDATLNTNSGSTNGAIINTGSAQNQALQFVTLAGDAAFGGTARWDIRANPTATLSTGGNAYNLVKGGANQVSLVGVTVDSALANIDVQSGILSYESTTTGLGNPTNTLTVEGGATLQLWNPANALNKQIILTDNSTLNAGNGSNTIAGPINLPGNLSGGPTLTAAAGATLLLNGVVSGPGNVTKAGAGTVTLAATNVFSGTITINAGSLRINSATTNNNSITVADSATLGVMAAGTNQLSPSSLTLGAGSGAVTNEFAALASTTFAPLNPAALTLNDPVTINVSSGTFTAGQTYPLITFGSISGAGSYVLGSLPVGVSGVLVTNGSTIGLSVTSVVFNDVWTAAASTNWDIATSVNWTVNGAAGTFANGNLVQFDDTSSNANVFVTTTVSPGNMTFNNTLKNYAVSGSTIAGGGSLIKSGSGSLTLAGANSFSGGTTLNAGTLNINNATAIGSGTFTIGSAVIDNTSGSAVTLANNNAQSWGNGFTFSGSQSLNLGAGAVAMNTNCALAVNAGTLTVGGVISDGGSGFNLAKSGGGTLTLAGAKNFGGNTTISGGTLQVTNNPLPATTVAFANTSGTVTLDITGLSQTNAGMTFGTQTSGGVTITGNAATSLTLTPATLAFTPATNATSSLTVNMASVGTFVYSNGSGTVSASSGGTSSFNGGGSTVTLAGGSNSITANTLNIGSTGSGNSGAAPVSALILGTNSAINVNNLGVGNSGSRCGATLTAGSGKLTIRGAAVPAPSLIIGRSDSFQASDNTTSTFDATAGTLDALFGSAILGWDDRGSASARGITIRANLNMGAGTMTVSNLVLGLLTASYVNGTYSITSTLNLTNAGNATITNIVFADNEATSSPTNLTMNGVINLNGGATLNTLDIAQGNTNGVTALNTRINWTNGTMANISGGDLKVSGVNVVLGGSSAFNIDATSTGSAVSSVISGPGALTKNGNGTLWLDGTETYTGNTVISLGTLALTNITTLASTNIVIAGGATFDVSGLTTTPLALAAGQSIGNNSATALVNGGVDATGGKLGLAYAAGTPAISIRNGALTLATGTTATVNNTGAALGNGSYKLISAGTGGSVAGTAPAAVAVTGGGIGSGGTAALAISGSELYLNVSGVVTVNTNSPVLTNSISGNTLTLSWPADHLGWRLLVQTNSLSTGLGTNWFTWPNSTNLTTVPVTIYPANPSVFFRLVYP
jgi:fibronectin-binding autotransporter adhesin